MSTSTVRQIRESFDLLLKVEESLESSKRSKSALNYVKSGLDDYYGNMYDILHKVYRFLSLYDGAEKISEGLSVKVDWDIYFDHVSPLRKNAIYSHFVAKVIEQCCIREGMSNLGASLPIGASNECLWYFKKNHDSLVKSSNSAVRVRFSQHLSESSSMGNIVKLLDDSSAIGDQIARHIEATRLGLNDSYSNDFTDELSNSYEFHNYFRLLNTSRWGKDRNNKNDALSLAHTEYDNRKSNGCAILVTATSGLSSLNSPFVFDPFSAVTLIQLKWEYKTKKEMLGRLEEEMKRLGEKENRFNFAMDHGHIDRRKAAHLKQISRSLLIAQGYSSLVRIQNVVSCKTRAFVRRSSIAKKKLSLLSKTNNGIIDTALSTIEIIEEKVRKYLLDKLKLDEETVGYRSRVEEFEGDLTKKFTTNSGSRLLAISESLSNESFAVRWHAAYSGDELVYFLYRMQEHIENLKEKASIRLYSKESALYEYFPIDSIEQLKKTVVSSKFHHIISSIEIDFEDFSIFYAAGFNEFGGAPCLEVLGSNKHHVEELSQALYEKSSPEPLASSCIFEK